VVNAQQVKKVPGRKTDVSDAEWWAISPDRDCCAAAWCHPRRSATCAPSAGTISVPVPCHRIARVVFVVLSRRVPYQDSTVDDQALAVMKRAPRRIRQPKKYDWLPVTA